MSKRALPKTTAKTTKGSASAKPAKAAVANRERVVSKKVESKSAVSMTTQILYPKRLVPKKLDPTKPGAKAELLRELCTVLEAELQELKRLARDAALAATHEENKPESDKDMRSTEASYLARGQAERAMRVEEAFVRLSSIATKDHSPDAPVTAPALVEVLEGDVTSWFLFVPAGGGVMLSGDVRSIAPQSPLGSVLLGLQEGEEAEVQSPQGKRTVTVMSVR
jgi:transcription elongation GreA/GreB family factor